MREVISFQKARDQRSVGSTLDDLGFRPEESHRCPRAGDLFLVPAQLPGDADAVLLLDTGAAEGVTLDLQYAARRRLTIEETVLKPAPIAGLRPRVAGVARFGRWTALGREAQESRVSVCDVFSGSPLQGQVAGLLGCDFFRRGVLAIHPATSRIAFTTRKGIAAGRTAAGEQFRMLKTGQDVLPVTGDLSETTLADHGSPILVFDTGSVGSALAVDYFRRGRSVLWRWIAEVKHRRRRKLSWTFDAPGGGVLQTKIEIIATLSQYAAGIGVPRVDGIVGMDVLRDWLPVFDFVGGNIFLVRDIRGSS